MRLVFGTNQMTSSCYTNCASKQLYAPVSPHSSSYTFSTNTLLSAPHLWTWLSKPMLAICVVASTSQLLLILPQIVSLVALSTSRRLKLFVCVVILPIDEVFSRCVDFPLRVRGSIFDVLNRLRK